MLTLQQELKTGYLFISMIKIRLRIAFYIIASDGGIYKYSQEFHFMEGYYYRVKKKMYERPCHLSLGL